jgi:Cyclic nucleotide-binding domain
MRCTIRGGEPGFLPEVFASPSNAVATGSIMNVKDWLPTSIQGSGIERKLVAGQMLYGQGDAAIGLYEVVSGKVRQVRIDPEGRDVVVGIACPGDVIGEGALFSCMIVLRQR